MTQSKVELDRGIREFLKRDSVKYQWCFYSKVLELEDELPQGTYIDERQKSVVDHYLFLTPVGRSFMSEFIFYRKVEATPQLSFELIQVSNLFAEPRLNLEAESSVPEKYGLIAPVSESPLVSTPASDQFNAREIEKDLELAPN